ncbi:MAG: Crp/Fnr family transcriptional regulator [Thermodesulfobacteriota bacterium]
MISLDFLKNVEAFGGLNNAQLKLIQDSSSIEEFKLGDRLFMQDEEATHLWIVKKGQVDLHLEQEDVPADKRQSISFISKAQTFGWSCFASPHNYRLSGYCATQSCEVVKIDKNRLIDMFEKDPVCGYQVMSYLLNVMGTQFVQYQNEIAKCIGDHIIHKW